MAGDRPVSRCTRGMGAVIREGAIGCGRGGAAVESDVGRTGIVSKGAITRARGIVEVRDAGTCALSRASIIGDRRASGGRAVVE